MHNNINQEPKPLIYHKIRSLSGFISRPLLITPYIFFIHQKVAKPTLKGKITTARPSRILKSEILEADEPDEADNIYQYNPWHRDEKHLLPRLHIVDQRLQQQNTHSYQ